MSETPPQVTPALQQQAYITQLNICLLKQDQNLQSHTAFGIYSNRLLIFPVKASNLHTRSSFYQSNRLCRLSELKNSICV